MLCSRCHAAMVIGEDGWANCSKCGKAQFVGPKPAAEPKPEAEGEGGEGEGEE